MNIAFASDDGRTISPHFGRAEFFVMVKVEDGRVVERKLIGKESAACNCSHNVEDPAQDHEKHDSRHKAIFEPLELCSVVIAGGMGSGAFQRLKNMQVEVLLTDLREIDTAIKGFLSGTLIHQEILVH